MIITITTEIHMIFSRPAVVKVHSHKATIASEPITLRRVVNGASSGMTIQSRAA